MIIGTIFGQLSAHAYSEETTPNLSNETYNNNWDQLPLDILSGAHLILEPNLTSFGIAEEKDGFSVTQSIHVYPGLEIKLMVGDVAWIGYNKNLSPESVIYSKGKKTKKEEIITVVIPDNVFYLRGSGRGQTGIPRAWVKNFALYAARCGLICPDLSDYTEITELSFNQHSRKDTGGSFDENSEQYPSVGDMFFIPIGTDIVVTFNNSNIAPYIHSGKNFNLVSLRNNFSRHYSFGYCWYHCKVEDICNFLGAYYETVNGSIKKLTLDELRKSEPHLYIRFPGKVSGTEFAARNRTKGVKENYQRLFTIVHVTDIHGDMDSTHAAYEYADQIGADCIALTGDLVLNRPYHGCNILHSIIKKAKTPTVYSIGNHDVIGYSDKEVYEMNIAPVKDILCASKEHAYYYRDFSNNGETIRLISLYPFFENSAVRVKGYYTQEQLLWLCDAMASVPNGGHILILRHFSHRRPVVAENKEIFYDFADSSVEGDDLWLNMKCDPVAEIVDAYNERSRIFAKYTGELKNGEETITIKYDFSTRPNAEFVAYLTGHFHVDCIGYARGTKTKQVVLCSQCTVGVKGTEEYDAFTFLSSPRDYGTDSQIGLNVFSFNFENKVIYIARVGNGLEKEHEKKYMELSY